MPTISAPAPTGNDDTNLLNDWIESLPFATLAMFPSAVYRCEHAVVVTKVGLILDGLRLLRTDPHAARPSGAEDNRRVEMLNIKSSLGVTVRNYLLRGPKPVSAGYMQKREGQHGIGVHGGKDISVGLGRVEHVHGDFVYLGGRGKERPTNVKIDGLLGVDAGRHQVCVTAVDGLYVNVRCYGYTLDGYHTERMSARARWPGKDWINVTVAPASVFQRTIPAGML